MKRTDAVIEEGMRANLDGEPLQKTWNVLSPQGFRFEEGRHSQVEFSLKEARDTARTWDFEECPLDCECRDDN